ncbi:Unknown protein [Striga hermonthica]|uniref:Uncharacterized protein n=1 Tax=Striga hermonthica TaxID=68872 RepID=A0A9N7NWX3_STRHE|nr:Unknown protein [Striga hermonthica]
MALKHAHSFLHTATKSRKQTNNMFMMRLAHYHSKTQAGRKSPDPEEYQGEVLPSEWHAKAFSRLRKWGPSLKNLDLIGGRLVNTDDGSRVFDKQLERKMQAFKSFSRALIELPSTKEIMRNNFLSTFPDAQGKEIHYFDKPHERDALTVNSLTKVADILSISPQQRKVVRHKICPQVTNHQLWAGALVEILNQLKSEIEGLNRAHSGLSKEMGLAQQVVVNCLKSLGPAVTHDPESSSWMRLKPKKVVDSNEPAKWEEVLEMATDLINCLSEENELAFHILKLEVMKEGLYQIRDVVIDRGIGYKEARYQEHLVQKNLIKGLGYSSRCLFTLLMYYLYGSVWDIEVDVRGGVFGSSGGKGVCLYMGKILTVDEEKVVLDGVKQLDRALGLFKFVWESAEMKGDLELQGHLWCVGAENRVVKYRGNKYFVHEINL